jgi:UTP:GlnB (protein PII) uridylyltransferase
MANPQLTADQLQVANELLAGIRQRLRDASGGSPELLFALRRKIAKELVYDERGKPMFRRALKRKKRIEQGNLCPVCNTELPEKYVVLDRRNAIGGYTMENTRLLCQPCDFRLQADKGYA